MQDGTNTQERSPRIAIWTERFNRLLEHYDANTLDPGQRLLPGLDRYGRFALVITNSTGYVIARTSSLIRCEVAAVEALAQGMKILCAHDLGTLDGSPPALEPGDEVLDENGEWRTIIEALDGIDSRRMLVFDADDANAYIYEDETDEDGGVHRKRDDRWPVKHDVAAIRTIVVFNTTPTTTVTA